MSITIINPENTKKDFLSSELQLANTALQTLENTTVKKVEELGSEQEPEHVRDVKVLTKTELREKYPSTYSSHKNMKSRCKKGLGVLAPKLESFDDFLLHVGPRPNANYTLDRLDNDNPTYGPGFVEWRDKYAQNSNKSNNVFLTHDDGRTHTVAQWAKITSQKKENLYKRRQLGWADMEIITGERVKDLPDPLDSTPWPYKTREDWERRYQTAEARGNGKTRMEYLYLRAKKDVEILTMQVEEMEAGHGDNKLLAYCHTEYLEKLQRLCRAQQLKNGAQMQLEFDRRMKAFIHRTSAVNSAQEKVIFLRVNKRPLFTINKKPA